MENLEIKAGMNRFRWGMQKPQTGANAAGGGGRAGRGGAAGGAAATPPAAGAAATPPAEGAAPADPAAAFAQFRGGRGGAGGTPFIIGGGRGGSGNAGGGPVEPGLYLVRLTVGDKTFNSSVNVLEDIWARPQ